MNSALSAVSFAVATAALALDLPAQAVQFTLDAPNQLVVTSSVGGMATATLGPTGPLPMFSVLTSTIGSGAAVASLACYVESGASFGQFDSEITFHFDIEAEVTPPSPTSATATIPTSEFLVTLSANAPRQVLLQFERDLAATPGVAAPTLEIDVLNDGTVDFGGTSFGSAMTVAFEVTPTPSPILFRLQGGVSSATAYTVLRAGLRMRVLPQNSLLVDSFFGGCGVALPADALLVEPSFASGGVRLETPVSIGDFVVGVVGLGQQPAVLPSAPPVSGCVLFPTADLLFLLKTPGVPSTPAQIPLPAAVRPVLFYVQAVGIGTQGFVTSEAFSVNAF